MIYEHFCATGGYVAVQGLALKELLTHVHFRKCEVSQSNALTNTTDSYEQGRWLA